MELGTTLTSRSMKTVIKNYLDWQVAVMPDVEPLFGSNLDLLNRTLTECSEKASKLSVNLDPMNLKDDFIETNLN